LHKAVHKWVQKFSQWRSKDTDDEEVKMEACKWLRQQPKDVYAAGYNTLVKQWDRRINVGGEYVKK
jgi:hypothetical protein